MAIIFLPCLPKKAEVEKKDHDPGKISEGGQGIAKVEVRKAIFDVGPI